MISFSSNLGSFAKKQTNAHSPSDFSYINASLFQQLLRRAILLPPPLQDRETLQVEEVWRERAGYKQEEGLGLLILVVIIALSKSTRIVSAQRQHFQSRDSPSKSLLLPPPPPPFHCCCSFSGELLSQIE